MCKHERLIKFTLKQARKNPTNMKHKLGAIVACGTWIVAVGYNHWKSLDNSIHAEVHAIRCALRHKADLSDCTIYVARFCRTKVGIAKPCEECMDAIRKAGIKNIVYTESNPHNSKIKYRVI